MDFLPVFLRLHDVPCLIVGGGETASRKFRLLAAAGARVTVVAPTLTAELDRTRRDEALVHIDSEFEPSHLDAQQLVIAATADRSLNRWVAELADGRGVLCNVVDDPQACRFIMPAIVDRSPIMIAISSGGTAPVLVRRLREKIETLLPARIGTLAALAGRWRSRVVGRLREGGARRRFWERVFSGPASDAALAGRAEEADRLIARTLASAAAGSDRPAAGIAWLVGAGPGDPGLLTLRALQVAQEADVVLYDRLVSPEVLELTRRDAERIPVGKTPGGHCVSQEEISALLVRLVGEGRKVCRLKGGDPFIFGRGGEEAEALVAAGLPFEVVPGITAAAACGAYAGIPLTHREHSQSVVMITAHGKESIDRLDWPSLARDRQTLAFYMGVGRLGAIRARLLQHGRAPATPVAIVENGSLPGQRVLRGTLTELATLAERYEVQAPAILFVGEVAALAGRLSWFEGSGLVSPSNPEPLALTA
ncbi:siroheme synthase CysG [Lentisalinibacter sediminis]|uniref:siroheme synthase CysG n=1 Tax=Lentisalinibacter sediminis TaxID=2992237 RepID=UPI003862E7A3